MPGFVERALVRTTIMLAGTDWYRTTFAVLAALYLYGLARLLRAVFLRADLALAERARRAGRRPAVLAFALGHAGVWLPRIGALAGVTFVLAEGARSVHRSGLLAGSDTLESLLPISSAISRFFLG
jgi:hypothetical protein